MKPFLKALFLGFPIETIRPSDLSKRFDELISDFHSDLRPRFGTTVNSLVLGLASGWPFAKRDPEVVNLLRKTDLVGLDSPFLIRLATLLGTTIPLISSDDLLIQAALYAAQTGKKIYLIGGDEQACKEIASVLQKDYPGLKIIGYSAPRIFTKGLHLEHSIEEDADTIAKIQNANPDILLIQLGHPKQDLWFGRVKNMLKIPLSLGVGGAFERYLTKDNNKSEGSSDFSYSSIKRRLIAFTRFTIWSPLLFLYNTLNRLIYDLLYKHFANAPRSRKLFLSQDDALSVISCPTLLDTSEMNQWIVWFDEALEHDHIALDLQKVRHITLKGLGLLYSIKRRVDAASKNLFIFGVNADLRWFLKIHGAWDLFSPIICSDANDVLKRIKANTQGGDGHDFVAIEQSDEETILSIFGHLSGWEDDKHGLLNLNHLINGKDCFMDLSYCTSICNRGFGFLLKLRKRQSDKYSSLCIKEASRAIKKQFKLAKIFQYFTFKK